MQTLNKRLISPENPFRIRAMKIIATNSLNERKNWCDCCICPASTRILARNSNQVMVDTAAPLRRNQIHQEVWNL
jgi:hypothetical protein